MSTTWNAARVPRLPNRATRTLRIPRSLSVLGRLLVFLAWAALMAWAILVRAAPASAQDAPAAEGLVGTGIGALSRSERWESVPVARLRVEPRAGGAAIVASVPLRF
jgi:hypothetical protein